MKKVVAGLGVMFLMISRCSDAEEKEGTNTAALDDFKFIYEQK